MYRDNSTENSCLSVPPHEALRVRPPTLIPKTPAACVLLSPRERNEVRAIGFALYEVLLGLAIFAIGVIALGHAVGNCINASALTADDARVRRILANRMAEIETTPGQPDQVKVTKIDTGYGVVRLTQKTKPEPLQEANANVQGILRVTLTADWTRGGTQQKKEIAFYVFRFG
jgi:hypothetical protein